MATVQGHAQCSWKAKVVMNGLSTEFKVGTGADVTMVLPTLYYGLRSTPVLNKATRLLMGPCKQKLNYLGTFIAELQVKDTIAKEQVYVIKDLERPLLGKEPAEHLKLVSRLDSFSGDYYKSKVAYKYPKLFHRLGVMKDSYQITLKKALNPSKLQFQGKSLYHCIRGKKENWIECWNQVSYPKLTSPQIGVLPWCPKKQWQSQGLHGPQQAE